MAPMENQAKMAKRYVWFFRSYWNHALMIDRLMLRGGGGGYLTAIMTRRESGLWQKDSFVWQNFSRISNPFAWISGSLVTMSMNFVDLRMQGQFRILQSSEVQILKKIPIYQKLRLKTDPNVANFRWKTPIRAARPVSINNQVPLPLGWCHHVHR